MRTESLSFFSAHLGHLSHRNPTFHTLLPKVCLPKSACDGGLLWRVYRAGGEGILCSSVSSVPHFFSNKSHSGKIAWRSCVFVWCSRNTCVVLAQDWRSISVAFVWCLHGIGTAVAWPERSVSVALAWCSCSTGVASVWRWPGVCVAVAWRWCGIYVACSCRCGGVCVALAWFWHSFSVVLARR